MVRKIAPHLDFTDLDVLSSLRLLIPSFQNQPRKMELWDLARRVARRVPGLDRYVSSSSTPNPDGMHSQSLVSEIDSFHLDDNPVGSDVRLNSALQDRVLSRFANRAREFFSVELSLPTEGIESDVRKFFSLIDSNPARESTGGATGDRKNLWLHLLARQLEPTTVVESGVFVGRSLFTLWSAIPSASVHAFDISFDRLQFREKEIDYHEYDWSDSDVRNGPGPGLCYFDDHINNGRRIREAYERGFRHLVFDQCPRVSEVHPYRYPGMPTAMMIARGDFQEGDSVEYRWKDKTLRYQFDPSDTWGAEDVIDFACYFPAFEEGGQEVRHFAYVKLTEGADNEST